MLKKGMFVILGWAAIALSMSGCGGANALVQANVMANRDALAKPKDVPVPVPFDVALAGRALEKGPTTVSGVLYHQLSLKAPVSDPIWTMRPPTLMPKVKMFLYPDTPHLQALLKLEKENKEGRKRAPRKVQLTRYIPDTNFYRYAIFATTDEYGRYAFTELKPGRYYIIAQSQEISTSGVARVVTGTAYTTDGYYGANTTFYKDEEYEEHNMVAFDEFVEVKPGDKEIKLESRMRLVR